MSTSGVDPATGDTVACAALQVAGYAYALETGEIAMEGASEQLIGDPKVVGSCLRPGGRQQEAVSRETR